VSRSRSRRRPVGCPGTILTPAAAKCPALIQASTGKVTLDEFLVSTVEDLTVFHYMARLPIEERVRVVKRAKSMFESGSMRTGVGWYLIGCVRKYNCGDSGPPMGESARHNHLMRVDDTMSSNPSTPPPRARAGRDFGDAVMSASKTAGDQTRRGSSDPVPCTASIGVASCQDRCTAVANKTDAEPLRLSVNESAPDQSRRYTGDTVPYGTSDGAASCDDGYADAARRTAADPTRRCISDTMPFAASIGMPGHADRSAAAAAEPAELSRDSSLLMLHRARRSILAQENPALRDLVQQVMALVSPAVLDRLRSVAPVWQFVFAACVIAAPGSQSADSYWHAFRERQAQARQPEVPVGIADVPVPNSVKVVHLVSFGVPLGLAFGMLDRASMSVNNRGMRVSLSIGAAFLSAPEDALSDAVYHHVFGSARSPCVGNACESIVHALAHLFGLRSYPAGGRGITIVIGVYRANEEPPSAEDVADLRTMLEGYGTDAWLIVLLAPADSMCGQELMHRLGSPLVLDPWGSDRSPAPLWWAWAMPSADAPFPDWPARDRRPRSASQSSSQSTAGCSISRWVMPDPSILSSAADSVFLGEPVAQSHERALLPLREATPAGSRLLWRTSKLVRAFGLHGWVPLMRAVQQYAACEGCIDDASGLRVASSGPTAHACGELRYCLQCERVYRVLYSSPHGQCLADILSAWLGSPAFHQ
jgi:hypothetical protein